jgi:dihydrofolate synthase/folylpolyglutamate synthase
MNIKDFTEAKKYLYGFIPKNMEVVFAGGRGLARVKYLLGLMDNPQEKIKVVHIAGTSGKGSTAYLLSLQLEAIGERTGLFLSPHIKDIRERIQINNSLLTESKFVKYLNEIVPYVERVEGSMHGKPTYFEILTSLAFYIYLQEGVDYAVIETGLGGLLDGTNVVEGEKVCIITKLGMDHKEILGGTIEEIAEQKAGIITHGAIVITPEQERGGMEVLERTAKSKGAELFVLKEGVNFGHVEEEKIKTVFDFKFLDYQFNSLSVGLLGSYQAENCSLALAALILECTRDGLVVDEGRIRKALKGANFFGRMTRRRINDKNIIFDGAHNSQKMEVFIRAIRNIYPRRTFNFLISFVDTKEFEPMLRLIIPVARSIVVTSFSLGTQDLFRKSVDPEKVGRELSRMGFSRVKIILDPNEALRELLISEDKADVIVTGSFYLISVLANYEKN